MVAMNFEWDLTLLYIGNRNMFSLEIGFGIRMFCFYFSDEYLEIILVERESIT